MIVVVHSIPSFGGFDFKSYIQFYLGMSTSDGYPEIGLEPVKRVGSRTGTGQMGKGKVPGFNGPEPLGKGQFPKLIP